MPAGCAVPARAAPDPNRPRYHLDVNIDPAAREVQGTLRVEFTPDIETDKLVFRMWANSPRITRSGGSQSVQPTGDATVVDPTTLLVRLPSPAKPGKTIEYSLRYSLELPSTPTFDRIAQNGDNIRLGSFFPILAWEPGVGWATEPPVDAFAEASMAPVADFDVNLTVPAGLDVLATGTSDDGRHWKASAVRDFALSTGHFKRAEQDVNGVRITVGVANEVPEAPATYLRKLAAKLALFETLFGEYPWTSYTMAVTPELGGGIEYPMHVMQGPYTGGRTTTHELAHQWFYALVGNNQGRNPFLDEGMATYAEARGENSLPEIKATPIPPDARGQLDEQMTYWSQHRDSYYRGVYVQGAQAVASLGPPDRVDCALRIYLASNAYRIARASDLVKAMAAVFADTTKLAAYGVTSAP